MGVLQVFITIMYFECVIAGDCCHIRAENGQLQGADYNQTDQ